MIDIADALQIVLDLAKQNMAPNDPEFAEERARQQEAIDTVEDMAVNQFGDN